MTMNVLAVGHVMHVMAMADFVMMLGVHRHVMRRSGYARRHG